MGWLQVAYLMLTALGLGVNLAKHGEPRPAYSVWTALVGAAICLGILYWGGFFG
ncbi:hypothetical protein [Sinorhizobium meliloti]|uniref:hypothetical protein n=1 Tax=Rhizobium meliloti TaxID=382 RepID=UPI0013E2AF0D|nr:hypothetical protein [Sinorhizobium meliloti]